MTDGGPAQSTPLIPLLRPGEAVADPVVLATWYEALTNAIGVDLPHDLLALWVYPSSGGVELIGPTELAQDRLDVPRPNPTLTAESLEPLERAVGRAYPTVVTTPVTFGAGNVGLLLVGSLQPKAYGERERSLIARIAEAIAPTLGRVAYQWSPVAEQPQEPTRPVFDEIVATVSAGWTEARSPRDFTLLLSEALHRIVPHERLEILIPGPQPGQQYRLGSHAGPPPWTEPSLTLPREAPDLASLVGGGTEFLLGDATADSRWPAGFMAEDLPHGVPVRSVAGARIVSGGRLVGHLLAASTQSDLYQVEDVRALANAARLVAPKIEAYVASAHLAALRKQLNTLRHAPAHLASVADLLATTPNLADATRRVAEEARALLPCDSVSFALKLAEGDWVVQLQPGESRHLSDLPLVPVMGTVLGQVVRGELADALEESPQGTVLMVPLRAAGRTIGALVLAAKGFNALGRSDIAPAQQLANLVAPYLDLARRAATLPAPPFIPGWKRVGG